MKNNVSKNNIIGYIEGFYGRLLNWESRKLIVKSLSYNKMNTYLYAPKEDKYHRFKWRNDYSKAWRENKISIGNGSFKYRCVAKTKNGNMCKKNLIVIVNFVIFIQLLILDY